VFTYVEGVVHFVGRSIKNYILPSVKLRNSIPGLVAVSAILLLCVIGIGTAFIAFNEQYDFSTSLYFVVYTATVRALSVTSTMVRTVLYPFHVPHYRRWATVV
jgi:hypothetical protein